MGHRRCTPLSATRERGHVLYLTHNGLTDPLGRRQVLPYVTGLSSRGWDITVVSFEKAETALPDAVARVAAITGSAGVHWKPLRYHSKPRLLATALDVVLGVTRCLGLAWRVDLIHARSTVPALMAFVTSTMARKPWIFDLRGLLAQEYVDAGHWRSNGWLARLTAAVEAKLIRSADGLVTLTRRVLEELPRRAAASGGRPAAVIPCSVDLEVFRPSESARREVRNALGWADEPLLVYSGSLGSWYRLGEMLDFFAVAREVLAELRFLLVTPQAETATEAAFARGWGDRVAARKLPPDDVPRYLAAADAGICFLGRYSSKVASSPTKYGEYLAAGLPVVTNGWIGDARSLAPEPSWILVDEFSVASYRLAAARLKAMLASPGHVRSAARDLAVREFALGTAIDRYDALYRAVLER